MSAQPATKLPLAEPWYALPGAQVCQQLQSSIEQGLTPAEAAARAAQFGPNRLPDPVGKPFWRVFLGQFLSPLIYLLVAAAIVAWFVHEHSNAFFIAVVLLINAVIGAIQEWQAETSAQALRRLIQTMVTIRRGGHWLTVDSTQLVPGDIVQLESGQLIPADMRLLQAHSTQVDESLLTGESAAVTKNAAAEVPAGAPLADRTTMLHAGTTLITGRVVAVVVATGGHTAVGSIARAIAASTAAQPPLLERMERFAARLTWAAMALMVLLGTYLYTQGEPPVQIFMVVVALAVAAIPEGLPVAVTVALSLGVRRMAKRQVLVRRLPAVEGLGACSVICSDKTGTLTLNKMTTEVLVLPAGTRLTGDAIAASHRREVRRALLAAALCNDATIDDTGALGGDSVDVALLARAQQAGYRHARLARHFPRVRETPFDAGRRYAATYHPLGAAEVAAVKGAPETIARLCGTPDAPWLATADQLANEGYRVLALAAGPAEPVEKEAKGTAEDQLTYLGLVGLIDPLRPEVPMAVARCQAAGVRVCMVTGDHPATALAIGRQLGLASDLTQVVTGAEISALAATPEALADRIAEARVFARVEPLQKQQIIAALRARRLFVAVTGDGVNDAPALHDAHIGVAMGKGGTDIARQAADLILLDDNFASIVAGIEEGRIVYANVRKVVYLLLTTGLGEVTLFCLSLLAGLPMPLTAVQLLWLNLVSNGIQDVALAAESGEPHLMRQPPRPMQEGIFNRQMVQQVLLHGCYIGFAACAVFWYATKTLALPALAAQNLVLLAMVMFENAHVFNARSETRSIFKVKLSGNWWIVGAVVATQTIHQLAMNLPFTQQLLGVMPVPLSQWLQLALLAMGLIVLNELYKLWLRRR